MDKTLGTYKLIREIGKGGMGIVYKALNPATQEYVAVKILPPTMVDRSTVERFNREARAMSQLRHSNLLNVESHGMERGQHYLVMEYADGENLKARIRRAGPLPVGEALAVTRQLLAALEYIHGEGMIHRDVKPTNVILLPDGRVKLMDFGLVKIAGATNVTMEGTALGTPEYMSPEQVNGEEADSRTDLYSLGVTLFEMLGGVPPFTAESARAVMQKHLEAPIPEVRALVKGVPPELDAVIKKAMAKTVGERYQRAGEMVLDLQPLGPALLEKNSTLSAPSTEIMPDAARPTPADAVPCGPRPDKAVMFAALALAAAAGGFWFWRTHPEGTGWSLPGSSSAMVKRTQSDLERWEEADDHYLTGLEHFNSGRHRLAAEEYRRAIALRQDDPLYYKDLAQALEALGDRSGAKRAWQDYLRLDPQGKYAGAARTHLEKRP